MLVLDSFPSYEQANAFASMVRKKFGLRITVCDSQIESDMVDPFPFELTPPIVLVERTEGEVEDAIERSVGKFHGRFAGT